MLADRTQVLVRLLQMKSDQMRSAVQKSDQTHFGEQMSGRMQAAQRLASVLLLMYSSGQTRSGL
jgi:hypothetical protein